MFVLRSKYTELFLRKKVSGNIFFKKETAGFKKTPAVPNNAQ